MRLIKNRKYIHDCDQCVYIGTWVVDRLLGVKVENPYYDLYYHQRHDYRSFIARYGNEGTEYASAPCSLTRDFLSEMLRGTVLSESTRAIIIAMLYNMGVI